MIEIKGKYTAMVIACLDQIRKEMDRLYWNKYQIEMDSPFDNTGNTYRNDVFQVNAYYWGNNGEMIKRPNFSYKGLEVRWYKHSHRDPYILCDKEITLDFLAEMIDECINSMREDFKEII